MDETAECESIERFGWLEGLPGVESVDMVLAFFDDAQGVGEGAFDTNRSLNQVSRFVERNSFRSASKRNEFRSTFHESRNGI